MSPEHDTGGRLRGWIEMITGSMFSGKTEELIRRLRRTEFARQRISLFKPATDNRYHALNVVTHRGDTIAGIPVARAEDIIAQCGDADVVGIDEAQFFDEKLPAVCTALAGKGKRVIVSGLDMDYRGEPFGPVPHLLSIAEYVSKIHAICLKCGNLAYVSHRTSAVKEIVHLGETDSYEPLCRHCYNKALA